MSPQPAKSFRPLGDARQESSSPPGSEPSASTVSSSPARAEQPGPASPPQPFFGPTTIADIVQKAAPSVVNIVTTAPGGRQSRGKRKWGEIDEGGDLRITGSGVVLRADGYILTSLHVVSNARDIHVTTADGGQYIAQVVGKDSFTDLALLKIEAHGLQEANFAPSSRLRLGEWVVAIGNQYGLEHTVTCGLISGLKREAKAFTQSFGARTGAVKFIQTHAPINPGSSGGPLLNLSGQVIGINSFIRDDAQNIGFAIPASLASEVGEKLLRQGSISHPYIGIEMRDPSEVASLPDQEGVEVTGVKPASPASMAGLEPGDYIVEIDRNTVRSPEEVSRAVQQRSIGELLVMRVKRNGADRTLKVKIDKLPEEID